MRGATTADVLISVPTLRANADHFLVLGIAVRVQQADGERIDARPLEVGQLLLDGVWIKCPDDTSLSIQAFVDFQYFAEEGSGFVMARSNNRGRS